MKWYSTSYVIRKIKITMRQHYTPIRMPQIQNTGNTNRKHGHGCGATQRLSPCWWKCKMVQPLRNTVWQSPTKLNVTSPCDTALSLLGVYSNMLGIHVHTKSCTWTLIAALFIIDKIWMQPRFSTAGEWINKMWYMQVIEYNSVIKRHQTINQAMERPGKQMHITDRSQSKKTIYCVIQFITSWKGKIMETIERSVVTRSEVGKKMQDGGFLRQWKTLYDIIMIDICNYILAQTHWTDEWRLRWTMDFGWLWFVNVDSPSVNVPFWWVMLIMGGYIYARERCIWEIYVCTSQSSYKPKTALKNKVYLKLKRIHMP